MKLLSVCFHLVLATFLIFTTDVIAQESTASAKVGEPQVAEAVAGLVPIRFLPGDPFYFLITAKETVARLLKPNAAERFEFDFVLSGKRLKETYMLITEGMFDDARRNLGRYQERLDKMTYQLEKARSQNQDTSKQIGEVSDLFKNHELLIVYFASDRRLSSEVDGAINAFLKAIESVDILNPGVKDRYRLLIRQSEPPPSSSSSPQVILFEASPSVKPKRIIY